MGRSQPRRSTRAWGCLPRPSRRRARSVALLFGAATGRPTWTRMRPGRTNHPGRAIGEARGLAAAGKLPLPGLQRPEPKRRPRLVDRHLTDRPEPEVGEDRPERVAV